MSDLTDYEQLRLKKIEENRAKLTELGLDEQIDMTPAPPPKRRRRSISPPSEPTVRRQSRRQRGEEAEFTALLPGHEISFSEPLTEEEIAERERAREREMQELLEQWNADAVL